MPRDAESTRERILRAADALFYSERLSAVSMDRIAQTAGVTKKTLYYHFRSKDDLMGAYLEARHEPVMTRYQNWAGTDGTVACRMVRLFRNLGAASANRAWCGCSFLRAVCELADLPGHPASVAARRHKAAFEVWLRTLLEEEGARDSEMLARMLMILLDGAIAQVLVHRNPAYAEAAAVAAAVLIETGAAEANVKWQGPARQLTGKAA